MFIGIDIGGTNTRIATSSSPNEKSFDKLISFATTQNFNEGIEKLIASISKLTKSVEAIAIGVPGSVSEEGVFDGSTNLSQWVNVPLKEKLSERFQCPVLIRNDAEMGALGEAYFGQTKDNDFFYLTWGTGVGCAQISWEGDKAHVSRPEDREPIYALEHLIGGNDLQKRFNTPAKDLSETQWNEIALTLKETLPKLADHYNHNLFVLGGGIAVKQQELLEQTFVNLEYPKVIITNLEGQAGLYGALALLTSQDQ